MEPTERPPPKNPGSWREELCIQGEPSVNLCASVSSVVQKGLRAFLADDAHCHGKLADMPHRVFRAVHEATDNRGR
jgi:FPC/CPF motif-containing protein YcgG